jgi:hypothetical protein
VDVLTVVLVTLVILWIAGVALSVWWLMFKVTPAIKELMELGDEEDRAKVINALYPPRFPRS